MEMTSTESAKMTAVVRGQEVALRPGQLLRLEGDARGYEVEAECGRLWITQTGDAQDHLLRGGERFTIDRKGPVVVQALRDARARVRRVAHA